MVIIMRLLIAEDELDLAEALTVFFEKNQFSVYAVNDGFSAYEYGSSGEYDAIILDVMMPKLNGFEVLAKMRSRKLETPVIMLTALADEKDKIEGLDKGADDYVSKPFSFNELSARIRAVLRRRGKLLSDNKLEYRNASLDLTTFTLSTQKGSINLTGKEYELLRYLFEYPNFVATKENLILKAWGLNSEFESNNLEVYMSFLRKKLNHLEADFTIDSVRGVGYKLSGPKA